jgi:hypothetical protein
MTRDEYRKADKESRVFLLNACHASIHIVPYGERIFREMSSIVITANNSKAALNPLNGRKRTDNQSAMMTGFRNG